MTATLLTGIGQLATQSDELGEIENAAVLVEAGLIAWVGSARRAPAGSLRPRFCPTRTAAAELMPSGTMKESAAQFSAIS